MKNIKKILLIIVNCTLAICVGILFAGCNNSGSKNKDNEQQKYDVAIGLGLYEVDDMGYTRSDLLRRIEFPVGTDEITIEWKYTNRNIRLCIDNYNLPDHPRWSNDWVSPNGEGPNVFSVAGPIYRGEDDKWKEVQYVKNRGRYSYSIYAEATSDLWNPRSCRLYINVI